MTYATYLSPTGKAAVAQGVADLYAKRMKQRIERAVRKQVEDAFNQYRDIGFQPRGAMELALTDVLGRMPNGGAL